MQQRNSSIIKSSKRIDQNKFSKAGCSLNKNTKKKQQKNNSTLMKTMRKIRTNQKNYENGHKWISWTNHGISNPFKFRICYKTVD